MTDTSLVKSWVSKPEPFLEYDAVLPTVLPAAACVSHTGLIPER